MFADGMKISFPNNISHISITTNNMAIGIQHISNKIFYALEYIHLYLRISRLGPYVSRFGLHLRMFHYTWWAPYMNFHEDVMSWILWPKSPTRCIFHTCLYSLSQCILSNAEPLQWFVSYNWQRMWCLVFHAFSSSEGGFRQKYNGQLNT